MFTRCTYPNLVRREKSLLEVRWILGSELGLAQLATQTNIFGLMMMIILPFVISYCYRTIIYTNNSYCMLLLWQLWHVMANIYIYYYHYWWWWWWWWWWWCSASKVLYQSCTKELGSETFHWSQQRGRWHRAQRADAYGADWYPGPSAVSWVSLLSQHPDAHPNLSGNSIHLSDYEVIFVICGFAGCREDMGRWPYPAITSHLVSICFHGDIPGQLQRSLSVAHRCGIHCHRTRLFRGQARDITSAAETDQFVEEIPSGYVKIAIENGHL